MKDARAQKDFDACLEINPALKRRVGKTNRTGEGVAVNQALINEI
jgi:hypothetical protein